MYTYHNYCFTIPYTQVDSGYAKSELSQFVQFPYATIDKSLVPNLCLIAAYRRARVQEFRV